jgi:hypothetical protein
MNCYREITDEEKTAIEDAEKELSPCPFCGGQATIMYVPPHTHVFTDFMPDCDGEYFVECGGCTAAMAGGSVLSETAAAWNRRE